MSDIDNPQDITTPTVETPNTGPIEQTISMKAYQSLQTRYNELHNSNKELQETFLSAQQQIANLTTESQNRQAMLGEERSTRQTLEAELEPLRQNNLRAQAFKTLISSEQGLNLPSEAALKLFGILDTIPVGADLDTTVSNIRKIAEFGSVVAEHRQSTLQAGETPAYSPGVPGDQLPATADEWARKVHGKPMTDPIWKDFQKWSSTQE